MRQLIFALLCVGLFGAAMAAPPGERLQRWAGSPGGGDQSVILPPDQAFRLSATAPGERLLRFTWVVEEGYYLYRDKFSLTPLSAGLRIDQAGIDVPRGKIKQDAVFGEVEVNTGSVVIDAPLLQVPPPGDAPGGAVTARALAQYQGCKEDSICYPPIQRELAIELPYTGGDGAPAALSTQDRITKQLKQERVLINVLAFFVFGVLLSLTPCVFPMIPILSGIIVGQGGTMTGRRGLSLAVAYVLAMALTYALLGALAGSLRLNLQAASQQPWVIAGFSLAFVMLALSMFGWYELRIPSALQARLTRLSAPGASGGHAGAALMGAASAVIAGPCVAPPLAGALLYISQTGNALLGGTALFFMGLGFGAPLLLIGASAGSLLPRAGAWMQRVKQLFGVVMLGVAIWFSERVAPPGVTMTLWALLALLAASLMGLPRPGMGNRTVWSGLCGALLLVYSLTLFTGALTGADDARRPLARVLGEPPDDALPGVDFQDVKGDAALEAALARAADSGRIAMLDFYADWCVTCIEMEEHTFADPEVRQVLSEFVLARADVTRNDEADQRLLERFDLFGPPAVLFFDATGRELTAYRLIGYVKPQAFLQHLAGIVPAVAD